MRAEIERIVKELKIDRKCLFEVSKLKYVSILQKIEKTFVKNGGSIHWSNMGKGFNSDYPCQTVYIGNHRDWYHQLPNIVPFPEESVYVLFEDTLNYQPKYWVYEMYLPEFIMLVDNLSPDDFYLISKKYQWLISECHEDVVSFVGDDLNISMF